MYINKSEKDYIDTGIFLQNAKLKLIELTLDFLSVTKPSIFEFNQRKIWKEKYDSLIKEREELLNTQLDIYDYFDKIIEKMEQD